MNYQKVKKDYERAAYLLSVYDALKSCDIPEKLVHHFAPFAVASGYSLGEVTRIQCAGVLITERDTRTAYKGRAKRYNATAAHGYTCVNFNKKDLRKFLDLRAELSATPANARRFEIYDELRRMIYGAVDKQTAKHKAGVCGCIYFGDL